MTDLNIRYGLSSDIFIDGEINPKLIIEAGCWYLCTDTAELFLGVDTGSELTLKRINETDASIPVDDLVLKSDLNDIKQAIIQTVKPEVEELKTRVEEELLPKVETVDTLKDWVENKEYLQDIDFDGYATESYVKNAIAEAELNSEDVLSSLATKDDIKNLASTFYVDEKVAEIAIPEVPTKISAFINDKNYISAIPCEYITETELAAKGYLTEHQSLAGLATTQDIINLTEKVASVDTKVDMLAQDADKYLTHVPAEYITETELAARGYLTEHQSLAGYATEAFVTNKIAEAELNDKEVDLSGYATKDDLNKLATKEALATVENKIPSIEGLASIEYVDNAIANIPDVDLNGIASEDFVRQELARIEFPEHDLSGYYTKGEVDKLIPTDIVTSSQLDEALDNINLSGYATESWVNEQGFIKSIPDEYVTAEELAKEGFIKEHQSLAEYAKKTDLFSKSYNDLTNTPVIPSIDGLATETYVDNAISAIEPPVVDLSDYALKSDVDLKADEIPFTTHRYVSNAIGSFVAGESVRGLTVSELFAKLLGLSDIPQGVVENILANKYGLYQFNDSVEVEKIEFTLTNFDTAEEYASAPDKTTFYQYTYTNDEGQDVTESGYQHCTLAQDFIWYMVMLPSSLVIGENVKVQVWADEPRNMWTDTITTFESNLDVITANFAEAGLDMPEIPEGYTMWIDFSNTNPGNKVRYIIIE